VALDLDGKRGVARKIGVGFLAFDSSRERRWVGKRKRGSGGANTNLPGPVHLWTGGSNACPVQWFFYLLFDVDKPVLNDQGFHQA